MHKSITFHATPPPGVRIYRSTVHKDDVLTICGIIEGRKYELLSIQYEQDLAFILYFRIHGRSKYYTL